eukprot:g30428.t1
MARSPKRSRGFDDVTASAPPAARPRRPPRSFEETAALIGVVKELSNPRCARLCSHFLKNDCLWGDQCRFSHDASELRAGAPPTEEMNFANLEDGQVSRTLPVPKVQVKHFMTLKTRQVLLDSTGLSDLSWDDDADAPRCTLLGAAQQVDEAERRLRRAMTHCQWGVSEAKVLSLLAQKPCASAKLLLSPTVPSLAQGVWHLSAAKGRVTLGSAKSNDVLVPGALMSRQHALFELETERGALYILDVSTNGTFLNGHRLPKNGKVALCHGDELVFPEPSASGAGAKPVLGEFGFMVNLEFG